MRCLVADDRPGSRAFWMEALDRAGISGDVILTTEDATMALAARDYDLVLVDMMLGGGGGQIVTDFAAALSHAPPVVVMADRAVMSSGLPLALAPDGTAIERRQASPQEARMLLDRYRRKVGPPEVACAVRVGCLAAPVTARPSAPVARRPQVVASDACRSGPESGRV